MHEPSHLLKKQLVKQFKTHTKKEAKSIDFASFSLFILTVTIDHFIKN